MSTAPSHSTSSAELFERLSEHPPGPGQWHAVRGGPGSGKTRLLVRLHEELKSRSVYLSHVLDGGDIAENLMAQVIDAPAFAEREPELAEEIREGAVPFDEQVWRIRDALERHSGDLVILADGPSAWRGFSTESFDANHRIRSVIAATLYTGCAKVTTTSAQVPAARADQHWKLIPNRRPPREYLSWQWGDVQDEAEVAVRALEGARVSPVQFRLALLGVVAAVDVNPARVASRTFVQDVFWACARSGDEHLTALSAAWRALSVVRGTVTETLSARLMTEELTAMVPHDVVNCLIVDRDVHAPRMADPFRWQALKVQDDGHPATIAAHRRAAEHYRESNHSSRDWIEQIYHLGRGVDIEGLREVPPLFPEQLHEIGAFLSSRLHRYEDAAAVYEIAVERDPLDARAHHYHAFNLDLAGIAPSTVRGGYERALELRPQMVWWQSRWIRFLLERGERAAAIDAWERALDALTDAIDPAAPGAYLDLHLDVARLLLSQGDFEFAREILSDVPQSVLEGETSLAAALDYASRLEGVDPTFDYLPLWRITRDWLEMPPPLLELDEDGRGLREWWAARVQAVEADRAELVVAKVDALSRQLSEEATVRIDNHQLLQHARGELDVEPGRYLEVGLYGDDDEHIVVVEDRRPDTFDDPVVRVFPQPLRYEERALRDGTAFE